MKTWKFKLGIVGIFALGVVAGVVGTGLFVRYRMPYLGFTRPEQVVSHIMKSLDRKLDLTREQHQAIEPIVTESFAKMRALRARIAPEVETLIDQASQRVRPLLKPEQQSKLDEHYAEVKRRWQGYAGPAQPLPASAPAAPAPAK
jgi:hypothetical protein